jgi:hypothetical protein
VTQSSVPKAYIVVSAVLNNVSTFLSSHSFYVSFGVLVLVDCYVSSLGEPFVFLDVVCTNVIFIFPSMG